MNRAELERDAGKRNTMDKQLLDELRERANELWNIYARNAGAEKANAIIRKVSREDSKLTACLKPCEVSCCIRAFEKLLPDHDRF